MDIDRVDWSLFRSFLAAVDAGSMLGAAKRLGSHQPTLTRHIAELEFQLGATLFERTGRGLVPTASGRAIIDSARRMAASAAAIQASLIGANATATGVVRITASDVVAAYILPACIAELNRRNPTIEVELVASNQITNLLRREADIAVRMVRPTQTNLIARKLGDLPIGLFVSRDYARARGVPHALSDLFRHSLIGLDKDDTLIRALRTHGLAINREDFHVRTDNQVAYIQLIRAGAGVGVVPKTVGKTMADLLEVLEDAPASALPVWLVVHREIHDSPLIRTVFDGLSEHLSAIIHDKNFGTSNVIPAGAIA